MSMFFLLLICSLASSQEKPPNDDAEIKFDDKFYFNAVDFSPSATSHNRSLFRCIRRNHHSVFFELSNREVSITPNMYAPLAIRYALDAGLKTNIYMVVTRRRGPEAQVDKLAAFASDHHIYLRRLWIKLKWTEEWSTNTGVNVIFLNRLLDRLLYYHDITVGFFTNKEDWTKIVGAADVAKKFALWYANTGSETTPDFADVPPFAGLHSPEIKQYAMNVRECGILVNKNVYRKRL